MRSASLGVVVGAAIALSAGLAQASDTVATFADPSSNPTNPLFTFTGSSLSGQWLLPGLNLQQGGFLGGATFANSTFVMPPVLVTGGSGSIYDLGAGAITFRDSSSNVLLNISFTSAKVVSGLTFGSSDFWGFNVAFSGPILNGYVPSNETFSFAFANPVGTLGAYTVTSSFTSSADLAVPAPGACAMVGLAGLVAGRRRR